MFETVVPEITRAKSRLLLAETLPASIAVHVGGFALFLMASHWSVGFPDLPPRLSQAYSLVALAGPPPPPPPAAAPAKPQTQQVIPAQQQPAMEMAPNVVPDRIPEVAATSPAPVFLESVEGGVPGGIEGGVVGGDVGGVVHGTPGGVVIKPAPPADGRVHVARDGRLPMHPLSQVYPIYPDSARIRAEEGQLVVRYIIGTDGRVKDVIVLDHAEDKCFDDSAVRAIRNWRFRPMIKDGHPTEVVHELTILFRLQASG
jgi:protein TonB